MMQSALDLFLRRFITVGRLTVRWPDGRTQIYAGPPGSGPEAGVALRDRRTVRRLVLDPELSSRGSLYGGRPGPARRLDPRVARRAPGQSPDQSQGPSVAWLRRCGCPHLPPARPVQCGRPCSAERRAPL